MNKRIAVFGSANLKETDSDYQEALQIGRLLGQLGWDVVTGGYGGVMQAVSRGCCEGGGCALGIGLAFFTHHHNTYVNEFVKAKTLGERLDLFAAKCDMFLALAGGIGTITEVMYCWDITRAGASNKVPVLVYGQAWEKLLTLLKAEFVVMDSAFPLVQVIHTQNELTGYLRDWHGQ